MSTRKVKLLNESKRPDLIEPDGGGRDVFVNYSAILSEGYKTLSEGRIVEFDVREGERGSQATKESKSN